MEQLAFDDGVDHGTQTVVVLLGVVDDGVDGSLITPAHASTTAVDEEFRRDGPTDGV